MATLTVVAEIPVMHVVTAMTATTGVAHFDCAGHRTRMAGFAAQIEVRTIEFKGCPAIVVKIPERPVSRAVAGSTIGAELSLMNVFVTMTIDAGFRCIIEARRLVAIRAVRIAVRPDQRERGQSMVKQHIDRPAALVVTLATGLAELILMRIIILVTAITICFEKNFMDRLDVAIAANEIGMPAE